MSDSTRLSLWTGPRFVAGSALVRFLPRNVEAPWVESRQSVEDRLSFALPLDALAPPLAPGRIVQQEFRGEIREWIVSSRARRYVSDQNLALIQCVPIHHLLRMAPIQRLVEGGTPETAVAAVSLSPRELIGTFVVPMMTRWGYDIFRTGLVQAVERESVGMSGWTPLELLDWMAERYESAWNLRPDESAQAYRIDFGPDVRGGEGVRVVLQEGRQLSDFEVEDDLADLHTAVMVRGAIPAGTDQPATLADAVFRVDTVTADGGQSLVECSLPGSDMDPVLENGQHVGLYLQAADLTRHEILASTAPGTFRVADGSSFGASDLIQLAEDALGSGLTHLDSPAGVTASSLSEPVLGVYDMEGRGERGWSGNPYFTQPPAADLVEPVTHCGAWAATLSLSSTHTIKSLPASLTIPAGTRFFWRLGATASITSRVTSAEVTTDGAGAASVTFTASVSVTGDDCFFFWVGAMPFPGILSDSGVVLRSRPSASMDALDVSCDVDAVTLTAGADFGKLQVSGLPANVEIWPGDTIHRGNAADNFGVVLDYVQASGAGDASVRTLAVGSITRGSPPLPAEDQTLFRPGVSPSGFVGRVLMSPLIVGSPVQTVGITLPAAPRQIQALGIAGVMVMRNRPGITTEFTWGGVTADLRRQSDSTVLASTASDGDTLPAGVRSLGITLRVPLPLTTSEAVHLRVRRTGGGGPYWIFFRVAQIQTGADVAMPETSTSHANQLFGEAQRRLRRHRFGRPRYRARVLDLVEASDLSVADVGRLREGVRVRVDVPSADTTETLRVESIERGENPMDAVVLFETRPARFTRSVRSGVDESLGFVDVRFTEGVDRQTLLVRARAPTAGLPGATNPTVGDEDDLTDDPDPPEVELPLLPPGDLEVTA